jgi:hypothetical protein
LKNIITYFGNMLYQIMQASKLKDSSLLGCLVDNNVEISIFVGVGTLVPCTKMKTMRNIGCLTYLTPFAPPSTTSFWKVAPALVS